MTRPMEFYETPIGLTARLLDQVKLSKGMSVLDPCSGEGAILDGIAEILGGGINLLGNDLDTSRKAHLHEDATTDRGWRNMTELMGMPEWVISNPPFSKAHWIIPHALDHAQVGVAMLLPLRFMEPARDREKLLRDNPWTSQIVFSQPRPSFTEDGRTDSVTTFWAIWDKTKEPMSLFYATKGINGWHECGGK